ncbi:hypothetical protein KQX54_010680 [Cotesia glomerata]|uniref:Uncharacterized protein n=1 Tax=Cotesia glomerata TaxID=32391 RepID=A0AAV7HWK4_COTGL|nr:hypothetical protein KQX54_010680 [Cotesia glomerata]
MAGGLLPNYTCNHFLGITSPLRIDYQCFSLDAFNYIAALQLNSSPSIHQWKSCNISESFTFKIHLGILFILDSGSRCRTTIQHSSRTIQGPRSWNKTHRDLASTSTTKMDLHTRPRTREIEFQSLELTRRNTTASVHQNVQSRSLTMKLRCFMYIQPVHVIKPTNSMDVTYTWSYHTLKLKIPNQSIVSIQHHLQWPMEINIWKESLNG